MGFSPASSGSSGSGSGLPSQWTAGTHGDVVAAVDNANATPLTIEAMLTQNEPLLVVVDKTAHAALSINSQGSVALEAGGTSVNPLNVYGVLGQIADIVNIGTSVIETFRVIATGQAVLGAITAPADGDLSVGQCALWFDATNGAAKLMMKAKQADGTVKTGSVNVQT